MMFYCIFVTFPCGVLGQEWFLVISINDLCLIPYFKNERLISIFRLEIGRNHIISQSVGTKQHYVLQECIDI